MSKDKNSVTRTRFKYYLIKATSILIAIIPLLIFAIVKWNYIFAIEEKEATKVLSNMIGFVFLLIFIGLIVLKKTKLLKGVVGFWLVTLILYCFKTLDVSFLYSIALWASVGMTLSKAFDLLITNELKEKLTNLKQANINKEVNQENTDAIINAIKEINGRG
jgi:hypothetical protein